MYPRLNATGTVDHEAVVADGSGVRLVLRQVTLPFSGWALLDQELAALLSMVKVGEAASDSALAGSLGH